MTSRIDHLHNLKVIRSNLDEAIKLVEEELMKPERPALYHGQVWKHEWGDHFIVTKCENGFRLTSVISGNVWAGDKGFDGASKSFSYVGESNELIRVVNK